MGVLNMTLLKPLPLVVVRKRWLSRDRRERSLVSLCVLLLAGCGRYADFTLPAPDAAGPRAPFTWDAAPAPVLGRGPEAWDSGDVLNPSVIRFRGVYLNLYSGFDGKTWRTGLAASPDGVAWTKTGQAMTGQVLSPEGWEASWATNGSALVEDGEILYWYAAGNPPRIALARSRDGVAFTKQPEPVVPLGPRGSFDERGVSDPYVIRRGEFLYLFYLGQDRAARQTLRSRPLPRRRRVGETALESSARVGRSRSLRRKWFGRARGVVLRRILLDAVHRP